MSKQAGQPLTTEHDNDERKDINSNVLLEGTILVSGKEEHLKLMRNGLEIQTNASKGKTLSLAWQDVISAAKDKKSSGDQQSASFTLHYMYRQSNGKLRCKTLKITNKDGLGDQFVSVINENCQKVPGRPKNVFVIVNPIGGARRGRQIYEKTVAPLFELAGIHTTVKYTEKSKHAIEMGEQQDFTGYDAIIVVGGDGLYQEVLLGVTLQAQKKAGVDYNNPDTTFAKPDITFGVIPAGTGNGLAGWCNGVVDEETATLSIIRGKNDRAQILTVHSDGKFITLCGVVFGYGAFSDFVNKTDEKRWMGKARYAYCMLGALVKKPSMFNCNIEYRLADNQESQHGESNCSGGVAGAEAGAEWVVHTGNNGPICAMLSTICEQIKSGNGSVISPFGKCTDLLVDFGAGRTDLWKTVFKFISGKNTSENLPPKLECISRITGFRIKILSDETETGGNISVAHARAKELEHLLDIDGEVVRVDKPEVDVRIHSEFVSLYGDVRVPDEAKLK